MINKLRNAIVVVLLTINVGTYADESTQEIREAALKFSEKYPITYEEYDRLARSFLSVTAGEVKEWPEERKLKALTDAMQFKGLVTGLFMSYNADETLACLSWQSLKDVIRKVARYHVEGAVQIQKLPHKYPLLFAALDLKLSCLTPQGIEALNKARKQKK